MAKQQKIEDVKTSKRQMIEQLVQLRNPEDQKLETYSKLYESQFKAFEKSPRAKIMGITDEDRLALGECLTNYMLESNNQSNLGLDPLLALTVITSVFGNSTLPMFTSEQPLQDKQGVIYFENVIAKTTRGNVTAGQKLNAAASAKEVYPIGYASEGIYGIALGTGDGTAKTFTLNFGYTKLRKDYVAIQCGDLKITDDGHGHLVGYGAEGTVDYTAGTGSITFASAPAAGVQIIGNFQVATLNSNIVFS